MKYSKILGHSLLITFIATSSLYADQETPIDPSDAPNSDQVIDLNNLDKASNDFIKMLEGFANVGNELSKQAYGIDMAKEMGDPFGKINNEKSKSQILENKETNNPAVAESDDELKKVTDGAGEIFGATVKQSTDIAQGAFGILTKLAQKDLENLQKPDADKSESESELTPARKDASSLNSQGIMLAMFGDLENAIEKFKSSILTDSGFSSPYYNLACAYAQQNNTEQAITFLNKAITLNSKHKEMAKRDKDFQKMQSLPAFQELVK